MTLKAISANGARYALNEITGQLVEVNFVDPDQYRTFIPGDTSPMSLCSLLFDQTLVDVNWSPISNCEAIARISACQEAKREAGTLLCGCISVNRL